LAGLFPVRSIVDDRPEGTAERRNLLRIPEGAHENALGQLLDVIHIQILSMPLLQAHPACQNRALWVKGKVRGRRCGLCKRGEF
jgi:hypothetical protein